MAKPDTTYPNDLVLMPGTGKPDRFLSRIKKTEPVNLGLQTSNLMVSIIRLLDKTITDIRKNV
jgi:hypothetical protein